MHLSDPHLNPPKSVNVNPGGSWVTLCCHSGPCHCRMEMPIVSFGMKMFAAKNPPTMPVQNNVKRYELGRRLGKQGPRMRDQSPAPCEKSARGKHNCTNLLQINVSGLQHKVLELKKILKDHNVQIAVLQETILPKREIKISGYTQYKCNCGKCHDPCEE